MPYLIQQRKVKDKLLMLFSEQTNAILDILV